MAAAAANHASAAKTVNGITFDRVVDIVDRYGADNTGSTAIDGVLDEAIADGTLVVFPEGRYRIDRRHDLPGDATVGFLGLGNVQLVPRTGANFLALNARVRDPVDQVLFKNIDFDIRADNTVTGLRFNTKNGFHVENVEYVGRGTHSDGSVVKALTVTVRNSDAVGTVKDFVAKKGSSWARYKSGDGRTGIGVYQPHRGTVRIVDCHLEEFGNNGIYGSRHAGKVHIIGGVYRNNNVAQVRFGGKGNWVDGASIEVDPAKYTGPRESSYESGAFRMRGVWIEKRKFDPPAGAEVRNCDIVIEENPVPAAGVSVNDNAKSVTVTNTRIRQECSGTPAIRNERNGYPVTLDGVSITGDSVDGDAVRVGNAPKSTIRNCCIQQGGTNRNGVTLVDCEGSSVTDSTINVTGEAVNLVRCSAETKNIERNGTCPLPGSNTGDTSGSGDSSDSTGSDSSGSSDGGSSDGSGDSQLPNRLVIDGSGVSSRTAYSFEVSGDLEKDPSIGSVNSNDTISGSRADGQVYGGIDAYRFSGDVVAFDAGDGIVVSLNGDQVDPATLGASDLPRTVTIAGGSASNRISYVLEVDGDLEKSTAMDASVNSNDTISGSRADGQVAGGRDSYAFSGDVVTFDADGDVTVYVDGTQVDPATLGSDSSGSSDGSSDSSSPDQLPNSIVFDGTEASGRTAYSFEVSGDLEKDPSIGSVNPNDTISGSRADGQVYGGIDAYRFSGDLVAFSLDGTASVDFEDNDG